MILHLTKFQSPMCGENPMQSVCYLTPSRGKTSEPGLKKQNTIKPVRKAQTHG